MSSCCNQFLIHSMSSLCSHTKQNCGVSLQRQQLENTTRSLETTANNKSDPILCHYSFSRFALLFFSSFLFSNRCLLSAHATLVSMMCAAPSSHEPLQSSFLCLNSSNNVHSSLMMMATSTATRCHAAALAVSKKHNYFAATAAAFLNDFLMEVRVDPSKFCSLLLLEKEKVSRRCCERILTRHHLEESSGEER